MKSKTQIEKMDVSFYEEIKKIAAKRLYDGLDKRYSPPTVQRKLIKHPLWEKIKKDLEIAEFLKNDKAQFDPLLIFKFVVIAFLVVVLFGGLIWVTGLLNDTFMEIGIQNEGNALNVNLTQAAQMTFGQVNSSIQALRLVAITLIFSEILLVIILCLFSRVHPAMFIVWIFIVFFAVMLAAPISNAYESLLQQQVYGGLLESFTGANWILLNLPWITLLVGVFGGIFMFVNVIRGGGEEPL